MGLGTIVFIGVLALIALYVIAVYNKLVRLRALVREGFSGITVQLRRRADLVPNLVSTVEGYATHERQTLTEVTAHRSDPVKARGVQETAQADNAFTAMLGRLMVVAEAYPELQADENFRQLQTELSDVEGDIAVARQVYNDTVQTYDTARETVPTNVVARAFAFEPRQYFELDEPAAREAPRVRF